MTLRGFLGHPEQVLAGDLPYHLGVVAVDVRLGVRDELVVVGATDYLAAFAIDELCHSGAPFSR